MRQVVLVAATLVAFAAPSLAQEPAAKAPAEAASNAAVGSKGCLAVVDSGSHAFRNILLGGVAGAIVSKKQYKVVDAKDYPAHIGQKFHGNDLQTIQTSGTRIVILDKKYTPDDLHTACK